MQNQKDIQNNRYQSTQKPAFSFFSCLDCNRDQGQSNGSQFSGYATRKEALKLTLTPRAPSDRQAEDKHSKYELYANSSQQNDENKISVSKMKNRRSTILSQRQIEQVNTHQNLPDFLPRQAQRKTVHVVSNSYRLPQNDRLSIPEPDIRTSRPQSLVTLRQTQPAITFGFKQSAVPVHPHSTLQARPSRQQQLKPKPQSQIRLSQRQQYIAPPLQKREVLSPGTIHNSFTEFSRVPQPPKLLPQPPLEPIKELRQTNKTISEMYDQNQVYNSYTVPSNPSFKKISSSSSGSTPLPKLNKKQSAFGNGRYNLKIRQTVSIGGQESDHESFVMEDSEDLDRFKKLNVIEQSDEFCEHSTIKRSKGTWLKGLSMA